MNGSSRCMREINVEHAKELDFTREASNLRDVRANLATEIEVYEVAAEIAARRKRQGGKK